MIQIVVANQHGHQNHSWLYSNFACSTRRGLFGLSGMLPFKYTQALMGGQGLGGRRSNCCYSLYLSYTTLKYNANDILVYFWPWAKNKPRGLNSCLNHITTCLFFDLLLVADRMFSYCFASTCRGWHCSHEHFDNQLRGQPDRCRIHLLL